jgi:hypothetical protein
MAELKRIGQNNKDFQGALSKLGCPMELPGV